MAMKPRAMTKKKTPMRGGGVAKPKAKMMRGGAATKKKPAMARGGALKPAPNKGAASLPKAVRNKMGFMKRGGMASKKK